MPDTIRESMGGSMRNNVIISSLIQSIVPVAIALIAAGIYVGSTEQRLDALEKAAVEEVKPEDPGMGGEQPVQRIFTNSAPWGNWSDPLYCPKGQYVYGLQQKVERPQGKGDDTGMTAVTFYCR